MQKLMSRIDIKDLFKSYDNKNFILKNINLTIEPGEFIVLLGPSGCGKSTLLNLLAGLIDVTKGEIYFDSEKVNDVEPKDRKIAMVFQNYALYPHLNVYNNLAFALKIKKEKKDIIASKVESIAKLLKINEYLKKKPGELSGGQRQRVAIGKAIIQNPNIFLMDEPLSSLDANLRREMCEELIELHKKFNNTFIYVTHDQKEAMSLATKIVVMNDGQIMQIGSPYNIYNNPANEFVANFIGNTKINFYNLKIEYKNKVNLFGINLKLEFEKEYDKEKVKVAIRATDIKEVKQNGIDVLINNAEMIGHEYLVDVIYQNGSENQSIAYIKKISNQEIKNDSRTQIKINLNKLMFFDYETGERIKVKIN